MRIHGNTILHGYRNEAYYPAAREADRTVMFLSVAERNAALAALRAEAIRSGLSESAARSGIYPVRRRAARVERVSTPDDGLVNLVDL